MTLSFSLDQNLLDVYTDPIRIQGPIPEQSLSDDLLDTLLTKSDSAVGISAAYSSKHKLVALAIANATDVLILQPTSQPTQAAARKSLCDRLLCREVGNAFAFDLAQLALGLFQDYELRIDNAIDIQAAFASHVKNHYPCTSIEYALADKDEVNQNNVRKIFDPESMQWDPEDWKKRSDLAQRAWVSHYISQIPEVEHIFEQTERVCTSRLQEEYLQYLAKEARDKQRLESMRSSKITHDISSAEGDSDGRLKVRQSKFSDRMRISYNQRLKIHAEGPRGPYVVPGKIKKIKGKEVTIETKDGLIGKQIHSITTHGQDFPTMSATKQARLLLGALQGKGDVLGNPWFQYLSNHIGGVKWPLNFFPESTEPESPEAIRQFTRPLNDSQQVAVKHMLTRTKENCVTIVQGPPGTGKTSVIAAFVEGALQDGLRGIWLTAQTNVAVKNIAEKLASSGFFDWRLLVSIDFHLDWHEHLYAGGLCRNVIRSDAFSRATMIETLGGVQVVLCTLNMLSNPRLQAVKATIPLNTLVVDEASQILIHDYTPIITTYIETLRKICFIGDDKQLPPYGAEQVERLESIFEKEHLNGQAIFLDTQYRMPPQIGAFISAEVYEEQLQSNPNHPITSSTLACHFIDVADGQEARRDPGDTSWMNSAELQVVLQVAQRFEEEQRSFRIITPYDSQRNAIEKGMKENNLKWEDKCFNVDSFQGNEDDYIIISVVRSREIGFLKSERRTNVMLTRFKKGMVICSSKAFLTGVAASSLVGKLAAHVDERAWVNVNDLQNADL